MTFQWNNWCWTHNQVNLGQDSRMRISINSSTTTNFQQIDLAQSLELPTANSRKLTHCKAFRATIWTRRIGTRWVSRLSAPSYTAEHLDTQSKAWKTPPCQWAALCLSNTAWNWAMWTTDLYAFGMAQSNQPNHWTLQPHRGQNWTSAYDTPEPSRVIPWCCCSLIFLAAQFDFHFPLTSLPSFS